jgi:outer membrane protein insertion porin family
MRCRLLAAVRSGVFAGVLVFAIAVPAPAGAAGSDSSIDITGNHRVGGDMIRASFAGTDPAALDAGLKKLYATGLFADIKIARDGNRVLIIVTENPVIARVAFEGNKKLKDKDLQKDLQSKTGGPLSRPFVQGDVDHILEAYRLHGYFQAKIDPKTIDVKNGRVDLVFEIKEGDKLGVRQILFSGNRAFPGTKLEGVVKSGQTNLLSFLLDNDIYDADRIDNDRDLLRRFYVDHGYADARVTSTASYDAAKKGAVVTFVIAEGPQYHFGKVSVDSSMKTVDAAALQSYLRTQSGDVYDADAVDKTVEDLSMQIAKGGESFAAVEARRERQGDRHLINLVYAVAQGKRLYVERIDIHGNNKTRDDVIRREFDFGEGDPYNRALADRAERHLKALGYFKTVKITSQQGSAPDRVVLDVAVEEEQTGDFNISGGYSTQLGPLVQVSVGDRNFLGTGDIVKASVTYGQYARAFDLTFTDPYALGQRVSLGGEFFASQNLANTYQSFDSTVYGAKVLVGTPITENLGITWNYSIYNQGIALNPAFGTASLPIQQAAQAGAIWVSSIGNSVVYSTLDNPKSPSEGLRIQTNNDVAGLGGAARFARTTEDARYYHPIVGDVVGMVRAQSGYVAPWGGQQLPLLDGFFGGPQLVRGFAPNGFGPRDITPGTTMDNIGGNIYWTTSAELQAPVPGVPADANLKAALFSDVGSLWATGASSAANLSPAQQIANSRAPRASIGAGLIWDSMFGPIRVDYAFPLAKQPFDITQRLNFTAGGF